MKSIALFALGILSFTLPATAQEQTLASNGIDNGGFGAPVATITTIDGQAAIMTGGAGTWIIDHTAYLGFEGRNVVNHVDSRILGANGEPELLQLNEEAFRLGYINASDDVVHWTAGALIGWGSIGLTPRHDWALFNDDDSNTDWVDHYALIAPELGLELNVTRWMRIGLSGSYRLAFDVAGAGLNNADVSGPAGALALRFGSF